MTSRLLIFVLAAGVALGWYAPSFSARKAGAPVEASHLEVAREVPKKPDPVVLPREADGHFYADVIIGNAASTMLVDTGATVVALTGEDATAMGLQWDEGDVRPVARGAGGDVRGVMVTLDKVRVGDFEAHGVEAIIVPQGLGTSLLGQSFLSRIGTVQIESGRMILGS